jgi:(2Fe-2S) ferredoxin
MEGGLAARADLWDQVTVTGTACLGPCFSGPTMVVYPEGTWYAGVTVGDVETILEEHGCHGRPVQRLVYPWPEETS